MIKKDIENKEKISVRDRIINTAISLFYEEGFNETSLRAIARKAGTSETGILRVFESKLDILLAVFNKGYELIMHEIQINLLKKGLSIEQEEVIPVLMIIAETILNLGESEDDRSKNLLLLTIGEAGISVQKYKDNPEIAHNFKDKVINYIDRLFEHSCNSNIQPLEARCFFYGFIEHAIFGRVANLGNYNKNNVLMILSCLLECIIKKPETVNYDDLESHGISIRDLADSAKAMIESTKRLINVIEAIKK